ncbi:MAG TPA: aconitate hydratase AcnA [Burkholderiales bacterium]|nr:aconitate hydratase AcnA [Burkholderiales bacterium]
MSTQDLREACRRSIRLAGTEATIYSLPALAERGFERIARLPVSLRIVLESLLRNCDGRRVEEQHVLDLARWEARAERTAEIPFVVGRIVLQDVAGIPLLGDLAAMRAAAQRSGRSPRLVEPKVPVDQVIDHSLIVDYYGTPDAAQRNMQLEFERNDERFRFVKWAIKSFSGIRLIPPGFGILHQVNLEFLGRGLISSGGEYYPDTLVGTDSHTCMIAGLGVVGWGVGGIEAEAAMLGQPVNFLTPDVIGVRVTGALQPGVTATDLVLHVTEMLRRAKVVGKFVEFFGEGVANLTVPDRATVANMAPEYGATIGFFPFDEQTSRYMRETGRSEREIEAAEAYFRAQGCFGTVRDGQVDYSDVLELELGSVVPNVAGPKRPQDRVPLTALKTEFEAALRKPPAAGGYGKTGDTAAGSKVQNGDVLIAAITSCTNTSNPGVMLTAGLLAKKAVERGLAVKLSVKTSLAPGSLVVSKYLESTGLQRYLDQLGFGVVGYGCATCVGNSGPIDAELEREIEQNDVVACAVLSGNRNFEARVHGALRAAFLTSPPLVVAFALAGTVTKDLSSEALGQGKDGRPVYLRDVWPSQEEVTAALGEAARPEHYKSAYEVDFETANPLWKVIPVTGGDTFAWDARSSYLREPPYFTQPDLLESSLRPFTGARALAILGNSITTDHISPIGTIKTASPAGKYLQSLGVAPADFNNYGARRMNHEVMVRGTFANVRLRNMMVPGVEGGVTVHQPSGEQMSIYDAAMRYMQAQVPLFVFAGEEYGTGSARDWAAKGTRLLGVRAVIAKSFERIHRSNLVGMGVLPCQFAPDVSIESLDLKGDETFDLVGLDDHAVPRQAVTLIIHRAGKADQQLPLTLRLDTRAEIEYARRGGILPYVLETLG